MIAIIIIAALCAVIPAGIVYMVCWGRIISQESRMNAALTSAADVARIQSRTTDQGIELEELKAAVSSFQESIVHINNKLAGRIRHEEAAEKREIAKMQAEENGQSLPELPNIIPLSTPPKRPIYIKKMGG